MLNPGIVILFDGVHANIPTGFVRETALDGLFPKSQGTQAPNVTGGSATHSHSSPAHTHSIVHHTHSGDTSTTGVYGDNTNDTTDAQIMTEPHYHSYTTDTTSGGLLSDAITYGAASNLPPYYEFIPIKSTGYNFIPVNGVLLNKNTSRNGLVFHSASAGRYIKFAATNSNAGSTGGNYTNVHDISHGHTQVGHSHTGTSGNISNWERRNRNYGTPPDVMWPHTHTIYLDSAVQNVNSFIGSLTTPETVEPAYITLNAFKNSSDAPVLPEVGDIAMWLGSIASIPIGWVLCDGNNNTPNLTNKFIKLNASAGNPITGGSNTHTHSAQSHSHTSSGTHTHTGSVSPHQAGDRMVGNGNKPADPTQNHTLASVSTTTASYNSGNTTANSADNQPPYRTVAYIQLKFQTGGGAIVKRLLN